MSQGGGQGAKTGLYLIDMNENPKLTPLARCITARQDSGISNRKGEHSGVLITGARAILTPERLKVRQCGRRFKGPDEPMYALTTQDVHGVILLNGIIRRLMPIECFRLQGFADNQFQALADNGISDSQLYKMAGNSVTTNVVTAIAQKLAWEINQLPNETEETTCDYSVPRQSASTTRTSMPIRSAMPSDWSAVSFTSRPNSSMESAA